MLATPFVLGAAGANAILIDLAFVLDESVSIGDANYQTMKTGLANALNSIPTTGPDQYRIAVVSFATGVQTIVDPTIVTAANLASIQAAINADAFTGGYTNTPLALQTVGLIYQNAGELGDLSLINLSTDGNPRRWHWNLESQTLAARDSLVAAGWDGLSVEAIGTNLNIDFLLSLVAPQPATLVTDPTMLPNPAVAGFVLTVAGFEDYANAIEVKVQKIVGVPEPGTLGLLGAGLFGFGFARRKTAA